MAENVKPDAQLAEMMGRLEEILQTHQAAVYLPCFYRAAPPRIFIKRDAVQVLVKGNDIFAYEIELGNVVSDGYSEVEAGSYYLAFEFQPGRSFEVELDGVLLEKRLRHDGLTDEVRTLRDRLGVYDLVPVLEMRRLGNGRYNRVDLRIKKLDPGITLPAYAHDGDAGLDICSAEDLILEPGDRAMVGTGFAMALPEGYAAFVQPRSGLAARNGISIVNTPGLIDCHYRGEVKVILVNLGKEPFEIKRGDRIAQMVIQGVESAHVEVVGELDETARGEGGFGSTGV